MRPLAVTLCLLLGGSRIGIGAVAAAGLPAALHTPAAQHDHAQLSTRFCAVDKKITQREMTIARSIIGRRLHSVMGKTGHVSPAGGRCVRLSLPAGSGRLLAARDLVAPGLVVIADSGATAFGPGTPVRLTGRSKRSNPSRHPPVLRIVVPSDGVKRGSAAVAFDSTGNPTVTFTLTAHASKAWCSFTTHHISNHAAIVLDGQVVSDPTIESPICSGQTQITDLATTFVARIIAAYLDDGSLPVAFHLG